MAHIKMGHPREYTPPNIYPDYEWIKANEQSLFEQYGEKHIVVYEKQIIGLGDTGQEAIANAENNLAAEVEEVTPVVYPLHNPQQWLFHP